MDRSEHEEWLAELAISTEPCDDALTAVGWSVRLGVPRRRAELWIRLGLERGWAERVTVILDTISGMKRRVAGFRVVGPRREV